MCGNAASTSRPLAATSAVMPIFLSKASATRRFTDGQGGFHFNSAIAQIMELGNAMDDCGIAAGSREQKKALEALAEAFPGNPREHLEVEL